MTDNARADAAYDVLIVGGGAAGLSAALMLGRARRRVVVVDGGEPRNAPAAHMHGFLSRDGLPPSELLAMGRTEVAGYGVRLISGRVDGISHAGGRFRARLDDGSTLSALRVLVATGLRDELPGIPGVRERWGKDVAACPYCHGYEVRDRPVGVIGAPHLALLLRQWSHDLVYFPHEQPVTEEEYEQLAARGVRVVTGRVNRLAVEDGRVRGVEVEGAGSVLREAVFVTPRFTPRDEVLRALGAERLDSGFVAADPTGRTDVPGVWAAGNVVHPTAQVIHAAGQGSAAGAAINADLLREEVDRAVADRRALSAAGERAAHAARHRNGDPLD
ncbi:NAD(P)/FAD-dependent oxidoreductase [Streptomyces sp. NPDC059853]|uniref:NAD(P)/FAD-dependent oxidoreductase n=1 Tax=Streptomyces sp. NPDC059853 TaxID=3346973 RepID=UPI00364BBB80